MLACKLYWLPIMAYGFSVLLDRLLHAVFLTADNTTAYVSGSHAYIDLGMPRTNVEAIEANYFAV